MIYKLINIKYTLHCDFVLITLIRNTSQIDLQRFLARNSAQEKLQLFLV